MKLSYFAILFVALLAGVTLHAQFKEVGPPPMAPAAARQKLRSLLDNASPTNQRQTITTISGLLVWYRDLFDEELIAAWQRDTRANLPELIKPLADSRVAAAIVEYSWRQQRAATFTLTYAPVFVDMMSRYPDSAKPFLDDLQSTPTLSQSEAEAVCRILLDMPDTDVWKRNVRRILPAYLQTAERLLDQDARGDDQAKAYRAQVWQSELGSNTRSQAPARSLGESRRPVGDQITTVSPSRRLQVDARPGVRPGVEPDSPRAPDQSIAAPPIAEPPIAAPPVETAFNRSAPVPAPAPAPVTSAPYTGPRSGLLECSARIDIPQNGEYVFNDLPPGKLQFDYDTKTWDSRLLPGTGNSQRLVLTNRRPGSQKRCSVRWSLSQ